MIGFPIFACIVATARIQSPPTVIPVDPGIKYQTWEGWGTSLAWWAHMVGSYPEPIRTKLVDQVLGGLQLNILRYNIGGGEAPGMNTMELRARVPGFLGVDGKYDWNADPGQRWVLARGKALGANRFEAFSNSPPYFMTKSGSVTGAVGGGNNLRPESVTAFTDYLATVVDRAKQSWGIDFETLSPMNEPAANWWTYGGRQEGCHVDIGASQSELILSTRASLDRKGLTTAVSGTEESFNSWAVAAWDGLSLNARAATYRLNTHCYGGLAQRTVHQRAVRDTKRLWMSEYGDGDATGMTMANQIVRDLRHMMPTAWVYWQVIDAGGGWGCLDVDLNQRSTVAVTNRKYYVFGQFTRFLRPGCQFISVGDEGTVAAIQGDRLVLVTVSDTSRRVTYDLSRFAGPRTVTQVIRTSPSENAVRVKEVRNLNGRVPLELPAQSVTTIVVDGCRYLGRTFSGVYTIQSLKSGNVMDVPGGSHTEGTQLITWPFNAGPNQMWWFEGYGNGWVKMVNLESEQMAALWDSEANGFPVLQWSDNGDSTLPWRPAAVGNELRFENRRRPGLALTEVPSGSDGPATLNLRSWSGGDDQRWRPRFERPMYPERTPNRPVTP